LATMHFLVQRIKTPAEPGADGATNGQNFRSRRGG
jgi:hypothetical protein